MSEQPGQIPTEPAPQAQELTDDETKTIRSASMMAGAVVSGAEPGFFDTFKESFAQAKAVQGASPELRKILGGGFPEMPKGDKEQIQSRAMDLLQQATEILRAKAPNLLEEYRAVVLESSRAVAEAVRGTSAPEEEVLERIEAALGA